MQEDTDKELKPKVILGVAAHPDDLDFTSSGSLAKWAKEGAKVYYLILTDGSKGSNDEKMTSDQLKKIRNEEQRNAVKAIGGTDAFFLNYPDAMLEVTMDLKRDITRYIRKIKPDLVVTMDPTLIYGITRGFINHSDHRAAGQATIDCVYPIARDRLTFPELLEEGLGPHIVKTLLLTNFEKNNYKVDISNSFDQKIKAVEAHISQVSDLDSAKLWMKKMANEHAKDQEYDMAEAFIRIDL